MEILEEYGSIEQWEADKSGKWVIYSIDYILYIWSTLNGFKSYSVSQYGSIRALSVHDQSILSLESDYLVLRSLVSFKETRSFPVKILNNSKPILQLTANYMIMLQQSSHLYKVSVWTYSGEKLGQETVEGKRGIKIVSENDLISFAVIEEESIHLMSIPDMNTLSIINLSQRIKNVLHLQACFVILFYSGETWAMSHQGNPLHSLSTEGLAVDYYKGHIYVVMQSSICVYLESTFSCISSIKYNAKFPTSIAENCSLKVTALNIIWEYQNNLNILDKSSSEIIGLRHGNSSNLVGVSWHKDWNFYLVSENKIEYWTCYKNGWIPNEILTTSSYDRISAFYIQELHLLGFKSGYVAIFNSNRITHRVQHSALIVSDIKYIRTKEWIAVSYTNGQVLVLDKQLRKVKSLQEPFATFHINQKLERCSRISACLNAYNEISVFDMNTSRKCTENLVILDRISDFSFHVSAKYLMVSSFSGTFFLVTTSNWLVHQMIDIPRSIVSFQADPSGLFAMMITEINQGFSIEVYELGTSRQRFRYKIPHSDSLKVSRNGKLLISVGKHLIVWKLPSSESHLICKMLELLRSDPTYYTGLDFRPPNIPQSFVKSDLKSGQFNNSIYVPKHLLKDRPLQNDLLYDAPIVNKTEKLPRADEIDVYIDE